MFKNFPGAMPPRLPITIITQGKHSPSKVASALIGLTIKSLQSRFLKLKLAIWWVGIMLLQIHTLPIATKFNLADQF